MTSRTCFSRVDMGFNNPDMSWGELEPACPTAGARQPHSTAVDGTADSPAWSRKRQPYEPPRVARRDGRRDGAVPYAELHCHSNFSFLDGASHPEELAEEAARLGLEALAITDHDGFYGVVRFAEAARAVGLPTIFGAELSLGLTKPQNGMADPEGAHLVVLARDPQGYAQLCRAISQAQLRAATKGKPVYELRRAVPRCTTGTGWCSPVAARGRCPLALERDGPAAAARALADLVALLRARQRGRRAVGPRRPARLGPQRRAGRPGHPAKSTSSPPTTSTTPRRARRGWRRRWPPCGRGGQPRRDRPVAARRGHRAPAQRRRAGPAGSPAIPAWSSGRPSWAAALRVRPRSWSRPTCRRGPSPPATPR